MAENQKKTEVRVPTERHAELGQIWEGVFSDIVSIERNYIDKGPERTVEYTQAAAATCLRLCCDGIRESYRILARHDPEIRWFSQQHLALTLFPTPLSILLIELTELQHFRQSKLLTHRPSKSASEGPYNFCRRLVTAKAIATVDALVETRLTRIEAAKRVADTLNEANFPNQRKRPYSAQTIEDWDKRRDEKKGGFINMIERHQRDIECIVEDCRELDFTDEEIRGLILLRLRALIYAVSYNYKKR